MASTSDVASTSHATPLNSPISSPSPTVENVPLEDIAEMFSDVYWLRIHCRGRGFQCRECGNLSFTNEQWEYHNYYYHQEHQFQCTEMVVIMVNDNKKKVIPCKFTYSYECELFVHLKKVHRPEFIYCEICITPLSTKAHYKLHIFYYHSRHSEEESLDDKYLDRVLDFTLDIECGDMQRVRLRDLTSECDRCTPPLQNLTYRELLKHQKETHSVDYPCPVCPNVYSNFEELNFHKIVHYKEPSTPHYCETCRIIFINRIGVENHSFEIHNQLLNKCALCEKFFQHLYSLNKHVIKIHGGH